MSDAPDILKKILARKAEEIAERGERLGLPELRRQAEDSPPTRPFRENLERTIAGGQPAIIAEIKRASPSKGLLRDPFDPADIARSYAASGATGLSVLTDRDFFQGCEDYLREARAACPLPVLRKDFIIDPWQLYESALMGADAVLLIVRILPDPLLATLHTLARELGLDVLTEVFDSADIARANAVEAELVGINNRDLASFQTDTTHAGRFAAGIHAGAMVVALSGIVDDGDVRQTLAAGVSRLLVGEALVRASDPVALLRRWNSLHGG